MLDLVTPGESTPDEVGVGDAETPEARIPEVNIDRLIWRDTWHLIFNFGRKHSG
jgi:hypothetical protein